MTDIAFPAPVLASQAAFRAVMQAFARPGVVQPLAGAATPPAPLSGTAAAVALSLVDYETPVWLDAALSRDREVADWIRLRTGARVITDPVQAAFAFIADPMQMPAFDAYALGTPEYPDRSTTLVLQVREFHRGKRLVLHGPGIADHNDFSAQPLPADFENRLAANRAQFPRGVDLILLASDAVAALPRSVSAAAAGD
jgi:alpha-D-ribose 1-methylphosphonate 5-triphosphate synthase subunit PhnH